MKIFINILVWIFILIFNIYLKTTGERSGIRYFYLNLESLWLIAASASQYKDILS